MKRFAFLVLVIFLLSSCMNPTFVHVVEDMYRAVITDDYERAKSYFSDEFISEHDPIGDFLENLAADVRAMEGIDMLNSRELTKKQLASDIQEALDEKYSGNWRIVVSQITEDSVMLWIVERGEEQYYIVGEMRFSVEDYQEKVLQSKKLF